MGVHMPGRQKKNGLICSNMAVSADVRIDDDSAIHDFEPSAHTRN